MFIQTLKHGMAGLARMGGAVVRARSRRAIRTMLQFDEGLLRDIGLTRADVVECLSSPTDVNPVDFLDARARRNQARAASVTPPRERAAA